MVSAGKLDRILYLLEDEVRIEFIDLRRKLEMFIVKYFIV